MNIKSYISEHVKKDNVSVEEFGDVIVYLLEHGVITDPVEGTHSENDPACEKELYYKFKRVEKEIIEYLSIMGIGVNVNKEFRSIRVYAPDANFPKSKELKDEELSSNRMRLHINKDLSASLIVCYLIYQQHREEHKLINFVAVVSIFEFLSAFNSKLGIEYGENKTKTEKDLLFRTLKKLRVIDYRRDAIDNIDSNIVIRPLIYDVLLEEKVDGFLKQLAEKEVDDNED